MKKTTAAAIRKAVKYATRAMLAHVSELSDKEIERHIAVLESIEDRAKCVAETIKRIP